MSTDDLEDETSNIVETYLGRLHSLTIRRELTSFLFNKKVGFTAFFKSQKAYNDLLEDGIIEVFQQAGQDLFRLTFNGGEAVRIDWSGRHWRARDAER